MPLLTEGTAAGDQPCEGRPAHVHSLSASVLSSLPPSDTEGTVSFQLLLREEQRCYTLNLTVSEAKHGLET